MAHFAKIDENNKVIDVIKIDNADVEANGGDFSVQAEEWVNNKFKGIFKQTSYNSNNGKYLIENITETYEDGTTKARTFQELEKDSRCKRWNFAHIGGTYDPINDVFINKKPFNSWVLDTNDWNYKAPIVYPSIKTYGDNSPYFIVWDEDNLRWLGYDNVNNEFSWNPNFLSWSATGN